MPLHAQIACIGGNALFAFFFVLAGFQTLPTGQFGLSVFLLILAAAAIYTCWVLLKFRRYLSAEASLERELHVEKLQAEITELKAKHEPGATS
jgi:hypothetical protein